MRHTEFRWKRGGRRHEPGPGRGRLTRIRRRRERGFVVAALVGCLLAGCEPGSGPVDSFDDLNGNVVAQLGVASEVTDTAVIIDGRPEFTFGDYNRSLWLEHQWEYEYGGIGTFETDRLRKESWFFRFSHRLGPPSPVAPYVDHGEVSLADTLFWKSRSGSFIGYGGSPFSRVHYLNGGAITFSHASYLDELLSGAPLPFVSTGSEEAAAFEATISVRPGLTLQGVASGEELPFRSERPTVSAADGLVLEFDRPLEPARTFILLRPNLAHPPATAWLRLVEPSSRVVVSGEILQELLAAFEAAGGAAQVPADYILFVHEYHTEEGAIQGERTGEQGTEPFALDFVQQNGTRMFLRLDR